MVFAFARYASLLYGTSRTDSSRDGGLPASRFFARVHPKLGLPLNALMFSSVIVICFGFIFLGSSTYVPARVPARDRDAH